MLTVLNKQSIRRFKLQNDALVKFDSGKWVSEITVQALVMAGEGDII